MRTISLLLAVSTLAACTLDMSDQAPGPPTAGTAAELTTSSFQIDTIRAFPGGIHGMAVTDTGRLYFSDSFGNLGAKRFLYFLDPPYTGSITATRTSGAIPAGLLFDGGFLYLCDVSAGTVRKLDSRLRVVQQWTASAPWNITRLPDGTLLTVANGGQVQRLQSNGTATTLFSGLDAPFGIASAGDGTVWISEQGASAPGRVTRRTLTGAVVETIPYGWDNPEGLHVDDAGDLWIAETSLGQILRYDGVALELVGQNLGLPVVITRRGPGALLASSANLPAQLLGIDILP